MRAAKAKAYKKSESWKEDMAVPERKRYKNLFAKIKRAVRMVLFHSDEFPKEALRRIATAAESRIRDTFALRQSRISVYTLINLPNIKDIENSLKLPENTPNDWRKFFKSDELIMRLLPRQEGRVV